MLRTQFVFVCRTAAGTYRLGQAKVDFKFDRVKCNEHCNFNEYEVNSYGSECVLLPESKL